MKSGTDLESQYVVVADAQVVNSSPVNPNYDPSKVYPNNNTYTNTPVVNKQYFSRHPMHLNMCGFCNQPTQTRIVTKPSLMTWVAFAILLIVFWPLCWIFFVMDKAKQTDHYCTKCQNKVGSLAAFKDCCVKQSG